MGLESIGELGAVKAKPAAGLGMGGSELPTIFSGEVIKVSNAIAAINGLCDEFINEAKQVRDRWPMGLGKYLLDKLEESMPGNWVFMNGHAIGLSNKMSLFAELAARMTTYESVLAKMTARLSTLHKTGREYAKPPEWQGN